MTDLKVLLENVRTGEQLDLDAISQNGEGVQAVSGATGFGLPPVDVQWFEGAGDGAQARGYRVTPRDLDIPLFAAAADRAELKVLTAALSRVVAGPFLIKLYEDAVLYRTMEVYRVGGGTYTYGSDTTGEIDWQSVITVRAGNPFWLHAASTSEAIEYNADDPFTFTLVNEGSASAYPVWTFAGPFDSVTMQLMAPGTSETPLASLSWEGLVNVGETLTIDTQGARATLSDGTNAYTGLSAAPDLFKLEPGDNELSVTLTKPASLDRTNYVTNPTFGNSTHGWTEDTDMTGTVVAGQLVVESTSATTIAIPPPSVHKVISGFSAHAGENFEVRLSLFKSGPSEGALTIPHRVYIDVDGTTSIYTFGGTINLLEQLDIVHPFVVPSSGEVTISVMPGKGAGGWVASIVDQVYVGLPGAYFDGGTTDTLAITYAWTGTADASTSTAIASDHDAAGTVEIVARDWLVV